MNPQPLGEVVKQIRREATEMHQTTSEIREDLQSILASMAESNAAMANMIRKLQATPKDKLLNPFRAAQAEKKKD